MEPNGNTGNGECIQRGTFSGWTVRSANNGCVRKYFTRRATVQSWTAPEIMNNYLNQQTSYDRFGQQIEGTGHALIHTGIGGNSGDTSFMYSTNDPILWLHHGFIDYMWWEWQQRNPNSTNDYPTNPGIIKLTTYGVPVSSIFDTRSSEYCHTYPRWSVSAPSVDPNTLPTTAITRTTTTATTITRATTRVTTTTSIQTPTNSFGKFSPGNLGVIIGCRNARRALDVISLVPQIPQLPGYISPEDRTTLSKIRVPAQVPASYLQMNNIDPATALQDYLQSAIIACKLNLLPNFRPLVAF